MVTVISKSPDETLALGEAWGREAQRGWVIGLTGNLGAGKTQLVKGIARGLGVEGRVASPTFALVNEYTTGRLPLFHLDLYRLDTAEQIAVAGLETYLINPDGVTVVEWVERWLGDKASGAGTAGADHPPSPQFVRARFGDSFLRRVWIEGLDETERRICHEDSGH